MEKLKLVLLIGAAIIFGLFLLGVVIMIFGSIVMLLGGA